jgi:hypothetical protein
VAVFTYAGSGGAATTDVRRLGDQQANGSWGFNSNLLTFVQSAEYEPDITVNATGTDAFVVTVSGSNNNLVLARRVSMSTGATSSVALGYHAALPVRIRWNDTLQAAIAIGAQANIGDAPTWRMDKIVWNGTSLTSTQVTNFPLTLLGPGEGHSKMPASDFDFDCLYVFGGTTQCVIAAVLHDTSATNHDVGNVFTHSFQISASGVFTWYDTDWQMIAGQDAQAIVGVALSPASQSGTLGDLTISAGERFGNGVANNTRVTAFHGLGVGQPTNPEFLLIGMKSDANTCDGPTQSGVTMGASTPHGGYSIAWCPSCGTAGEIMSLHQGSAGDGFCF